MVSWLQTSYMSKKQEFDKKHFNKTFKWKSILELLRA